MSWLSSNIAMFGIEFGIFIDDRVVNGVDPSSPYSAGAGWRALTTLSAEEGEDSGGGSIVWSAISDEWYRGGGVSASDYEIQAVEVSQTGTATRTGTLSTWETISATRSWTITTNTSGAKDWVLDITIREIADVSNSDTARITLSVEGTV